MWETVIWVVLHRLILSYFTLYISLDDIFSHEAGTIKKGWKVVNCFLLKDKNRSLFLFNPSFHAILCAIHLCKALISGERIKRLNWLFGEHKICFSLNFFHVIIHLACFYIGHNQGTGSEEGLTPDCTECF
jgi:hypothetical protein